MSSLVIGTAGHIDHGKTALVKMLTGMDTDRLKEEKKRGITIELGFANLILPCGKNAAIVDVPGHERFIKNMVAGVIGMDLALLIIAADEGIMPQTREHLDILRLLEIREIIVVISKIDLVESEYIALVKEEVEQLLKGTRYNNAKTVEVSASTGAGREKLISLLDEFAVRSDFKRKGPGFARLHIDRVFKMPGFGVVVTGTLNNGKLLVGDNVEILPRRRPARVRGLQVHNKTVDKAVAGQRVAVNLAGLEYSQVERGDVLAAPERLKPSRRLDLSCYLLPDAPDALRHMARVRFHHGTAEILGRVVLPWQQELQPGEEGFIQIVLENPLVAVRGDNYILRRYSPLQTIGGGRVIEPDAERRKLKDGWDTDELKTKETGNTEKIISLYITKKSKPVTLNELSVYSGLEDKEVLLYMQALEKEGEAVSLGSGEEQIYASTGYFEYWEKKISREIEIHLEKYPLEPGVKKEQLRSQYFSDMSTKMFNAVLEIFIARKSLSLTDNQYVTCYGHKLNIDKHLADKILAIEEYYLNKAWQIPYWKTVKEDLAIKEGDASQLLKFLLRTEKIYPLDGDTYIWHTLLETAQGELLKLAESKVEFTVAEARDALGTTRKVVVPLLEHLDKIKFTVRTGNVRRVVGKEK